jgi:hypothetical protein
MLNAPLTKVVEGFAISLILNEKLPPTKVCESNPFLTVR